MCAVSDGEREKSETHGFLGQMREVERVANPQEIVDVVLRIFGGGTGELIVLHHVNDRGFNLEIRVPFHLRNSYCRLVLVESRLTIVEYGPSFFSMFRVSTSMMLCFIASFHGGSPCLRSVPSASPFDLVIDRNERRVTSSHAPIKHKRHTISTIITRKLKN